MTVFLRRPTHRYEDPLARVWILCAERIGFKIARSPDTYASTDGHGTIIIGSDDILDPDDSLAQMIFHELCHALVEGEAGIGLADWGLDNTCGRHTWREHATLRLQAYLAGQVGLRDFFAPTTDFRVSFWGRLQDDPFAVTADAGGRRERSCVAARIAAWRSTQRPWAPHLQEALTASAAIAAAVRRTDAAPRQSATPTESDAMPSLWTTPIEPPAYHPAQHASIAAYHADHGCVDCAWSYGSRRRTRCRHAPETHIPDGAPACVRWEPAGELDCMSCGACCREAYHSVEIDAGERVARSHPELIVDCSSHLKLRRNGERCAALTGGDTPADSYACAIYAHRPRTCREFTRGSAHCLDARRRVGLSL